MIRKIINGLISYIASFVPTNKSICFSSFPDYTDNAYGLYYYMLKTGLNKKYLLVWIIFDKNRLNEIRQKVNNEGNIKVVYKYSFKGIWSYIRARYIFETHGCFPALNLKQHQDKHISLWHGMPLKKLGASIQEPCSQNCNYTIASSKLYQQIMSEAFNKPLERVLVTGQPRCDLIFEPTDWFEVAGINRKNYAMIGIWMPTYRKSIVGEIRLDGEFDDHSVSFLREEDMIKLDSFLKERNILLLLKIHPMDALQNTSFEMFTNIVLIKPQNFSSQLYPLLGACDFLLTDYSSVFIDYQIIHRPIGFVMNDVDSYSNSRGLYFENLEQMLPGVIITSYEQLLDFLSNPYVVENKVNYNDYFDNKASERICSFFNV